MQQRNVKSRKTAGSAVSSGAAASPPKSKSMSSSTQSATQRRARRKARSSQRRRTPIEAMVLGFVGILTLIIAVAFIYQFAVLSMEKDEQSLTAGTGGIGNLGNLRTKLLQRSKLSMAKASKAIKKKIKLGKDYANTRGHAALLKMKSGEVAVGAAADADTGGLSVANVPADASSDTEGPAHLFPPTPYLPIFPEIQNSRTLIEETLSGKPSIAGITALLQEYMSEFHDENMKLSAAKADSSEILESFYKVANEHLTPFDEAYRNKPIFPIRQDESIFLSLASFREHLLADTLQYAFDNAKYPDKLFIGAVVQNCFGKVMPDGTIDPTGLPCRTGAQVVGKNRNGRDMTKVSDAPIDKNGIEDFCTNEKYKKYCESGQVRVVYVHETESLGPAMARYHASKLWGGETYYVQTDSHLQFAMEWDEKYRDEFKATRTYPKSVLSSYPPGFNPGNGNTVRESSGARLCFCETKVEDPNPIVRINTGSGYRGDEPRPTQIPFIAAGFFFTSAEFLVDIPFDPFIPWCFMGEEIALSMRAWTHGWTIYAPRKNLIAHQYRPGRMGLPKFWGSVGKLYGRPGMNNKLQGPVIKRIKHMVGYPDASIEKIKEQNIEFVLEKADEYGLGTNRTMEEYMEFAGLSVDKKHDALQCHNIKWCNQGTKD